MAAHAVTTHKRRFDLVLRWTTLFYLGVMVVLPMVTLSVQAARPGFQPFWRALVRSLCLARPEAHLLHGPRDGRRSTP